MTIPESCPSLLNFCPCCPLRHLLVKCQVGEANAGPLVDRRKYVKRRLSKSCGYKLQSLFLLPKRLVLSISRALLSWRFSNMTQC